MTIKPFFDKAKSLLSSLYAANEAQEISFLLIQHLTGFSKTDILVDKNYPEFDEHIFESYLNRLSQNEPIQYVTGNSAFFGEDFAVNRHTLIPRSETEELVSIIMKENERKTKLRILDIGTGSGCIPISLQLKIPENEYIAIDISKEALEMAKQNSSRLNAKVDFQWVDIFEWQHQVFQSHKFDVIVSNPPYVLESDKIKMHHNVLNFEPELALFVPNNDALKYYEAILRFAQLNLNPMGRIYFEIHEDKGEEMSILMKKYHFYDAEIRNDFNNKARFAIGTFTP